MAKITPVVLDRTDRHLLELLQQDGSLSNLELADKVGLSPSPCSRRVKALEDSGLITGQPDSLKTN